MKLPSWLRSFWSWVCVGFIVASVVFIVGGLSWLSWCYWWDCSCREWLVTGSDEDRVEGDPEQAEVVPA